MGTADSEGIILDSNNFEGEINHIEIPHERKRQPDESLTEEDHSISRAELGKSMCVLRELRSRARFTTHRPPRELFLMVQKIDSMVANEDFTWS